MVTFLYISIYDEVGCFGLASPFYLFIFFWVYGDLLFPYSGETTSTKEWPNSLEVKGRVRIDAFEKFLQELPMSRSRAVMVSYGLPFFVTVYFRQASGSGSLQLQCGNLLYNFTYIYCDLIKGCTSNFLNGRTIWQKWGLLLASEFLLFLYVKVICLGS